MPTPLTPPNPRPHHLSIIAAALLLPALLWSALTPAVEVPPAQDLSADAAQAERNRTPILIAFSASYCEWCERVEQEFLIPMLISGNYSDKVIIRKVETDSHATLTDLSGERVGADRFAYDYDAYLTPTLIFIDHQGRELTERMVGLTTPEMFGGYLDDAIDQALARYRDSN